MHICLKELQFYENCLNVLQIVLHIKKLSHIEKEIHRCEESLIINKTTMGQVQSITESLLDVDSVHMQILRHSKVLSEINSLTYEEFKTCLDNLNALSRKCIDSNGKQLVFLVKCGSDSSLLWKARVKIACIKVDSQTRQIHSYKYLNLKQFLCVFKTFQSHLESLERSENQRFSASIIMNALHNNTENLHELSCPTSIFSHNDHGDECSICLDRSTEVILPCTHKFCTPCIEQWNVNSKTCPICCEALESTNETWVMSNIPGVEEINEKICAEFINLAKEK